MNIEIAIHGSYYARNFGDTLIISIIVDWVKEIYPDSTINLPYCSSDSEAKEIMGSNNYIIDPTLKNSKILIFGPGGYFGQPNFSFLRTNHWFYRNYKRHLCWNKKLYNKDIPYFIIGTGVGPLTNIFFRNKVKNLFSKAKLVAVRDINSFNYLKQWNVDMSNIKLTCDVALSVENSKINNKSTGLLGLHFPGTTLKNYNKSDLFLKFLTILNNDFNIIIIEDGPGQYHTKDEKSIYNKIRNNNELEVDVLEYKNPNVLIENLAKLDYIITSKLHVGILGYALKKQVLSIPLHQKTIRFYKQIDRENFCLNVKNISLNTLLETFDLLKKTPVSENIMFEESISTKFLLQNSIEKFIEKKFIT
jgi:polysaccharide pyruvyl transferase WcaK-like protein